MVNGWIEKPLGELFNFSGGLSASRADLSTKGYPYLHYGDIHGATRTFIDVCAESSIPRLDVELSKVSDASLLNDGDVVFVDASEDDEGASRHIVVRNTDRKPFISGLHTIVAKPKKDELDNRFKEFCFQTAKIRSQFKFYAVGTKVTGVSKTTIGKITLSYPQDKAEQRRIAEALSDINALITALEKLIAKKRAIKQGAMQELLTGKRRLPGFSSEWVEKKISDIGDTSSGGTPSRSIPRYFTGKTPWVTTSELNDNYIYSTAENITQEAISNSSAKLFPKGTILMAMYGATIGKLGVLAVNATTNQACCALFFNADIDLLFIYNLLLYHRADIIEFGSGAGQPNISQKIVRDFTFILPPSKEEQTAIAEILSDMDAEIDALMAKLNKLRSIKQGMMSELLTGRIRLIVQDAEAEPETTATPKVIELPKNESQVAAPHAGGHSQQFDDAVMIAGIVNVLYSDKFPLGRKKVQKCLYLLRRYQDESTAAFKKKAAGPYADEVRYKGGEPIAQGAKYITTTTTKGKGTTFARGSEIGKALGYIQSWGKQGDIQWVADKLRYKKVDELELLATVDMAICDLTEAGTPVSVASIKHLIATNAEWKAKLKKQTFSDTNIARAIRELNTLLQGGN